MNQNTIASIIMFSTLGIMFAVALTFFITVTTQNIDTSCSDWFTSHNGTGSYYGTPPWYC